MSEHGVLWCSGNSRSTERGVCLMMRVIVLRPPRRDATSQGRRSHSDSQSRRCLAATKHNNDYRPISTRTEGPKHTLAKS